MSRREKNTILLFGIYISLLLTCNEFLALFMPKILLRGVYIAVLAYILFEGLAKRNWKLQNKKGDICVLVYFLYMSGRYLIQVAFGNTSELSNSTFFQTSLPVLFYFIARKIDDSISNRIEISMILFTTASAMLGVLDQYIHFLPQMGSFAGGLYAGIGNGVYTVRGYSLAGSALSTGFICALALFFIFFKEEKLIKNRVCLFASIAILSTGLVLSLSRGAFMMLLLGAVVYIFQRKHIYGSNIGKKKAFAILGLIFVGILALMLFSDKIASTSIFGRLFRAGLNTTEHSNSLRIDFIHESIDRIGDSFVFGKGFGYVGSRANNLGITDSINTESYLLSLVVDGGIILLLLFLSCLIPAFRSIHDCKSLNNARYSSIVFGIFCWSILYIVLDSDLNGLFFWYCLGRINTVIHRDKVII